MEKLIIGSLNEPLFELYDKELTKVATRLNSTLSGDKLVVDQCLPVMYFEGYVNLYRYITSDQQEYITSDNRRYILKPAKVMPDKLVYGTPMWYYHDNALVGKFYIENVRRTSMFHFSITAVSAIGILDKQKHYGNVYRLAKFEDVAREIIGGNFNFTCAPEVAAIRVNNWLPYDTRRNNLHQLLFANGVVIHKNSDGDMHFTFPNVTEAKTFTKAETFENGSTVFNAPASSVELTEHSYQAFDSDVEEVLFDNVDNSQAADNTVVSFRNAPVHDLRADGTLQIIESGVNYAIVSGVGVLYGKPYTHTTRVLTASTGITTEESKAVSVDDAYMVNVLNSTNVLNRLVSYYKTSQTIKTAIVYNGEKTGEQYTLPNPFGGNSQAYMSKMDITSSSFMKATCEFLVGYVPPAGGNAYKNCMVITETQDVTLPDEVGDTVFVTLIGGGQAGFSGGKGETGGAGKASGDISSGGSGTITPTNGGLGGVFGSGGQGGKVLSISVPATPGQVVHVTIGAGGVGVVGDEEEPKAGGLGTPTTYGEYSSENGVVTPYGFVDVFTGEVYAVAGAAGQYAGGRGSGYEGGVGDSITYNGVTYTPGAQGQSSSRTGTNANGVSWSIMCTGGYGGGAAVATNGGNGSDGSTSSNNGNGFGVPGTGGRGADATVNGLDATTRGSGGSGGNGGGGGGAGGGGQHSRTSGLWGSSGGAGGNGSPGGRGGDGICFIYY